MSNAPIRWELSPCCDDCDAGLLSVDRSDDRGNWVRIEDVKELQTELAAANALIADLEKGLAIFVTEWGENDDE